MRAKLFCNRKRVGIALSQQLGFARRPAAPDRADRVNYVLGSQTVAFCCFGLPGLATTKQSALMHKLWPGGSMDSAVYATTTKQ